MGAVFVMFTVYGRLRLQLAKRFCNGMAYNIKILAKGCGVAGIEFHIPGI